MAPQSLQRSVSALLSSWRKGVNSQDSATPGPASLHESSSACQRCKSPFLGPSVLRFIMERHTYEQIEEESLPAAITSNALWRRISPLAKDVFVLRATDSVTALLVVLHDSDLTFILKAWPAQRAHDDPKELAAELTAAEVFPWSPLMPTLMASSEGSGKGEQQGCCCSIAPYAGISIRNLLKQPDWYETISEKDRLDFARLLVTQSLMAFEVMQQTGPGYYHRYVRPSNMCVNPVTEVVSIIDYTLMIPADLGGDHNAWTIGYYTPEQVDPKGRFSAFRKGADSFINSTTDVFLASYSALEVAVGLSGLPWLLQAKDYRIDAVSGFIGHLWEHADAAAAGYEALINRVHCPTARAFFRHTMCADPAQRPTPAQALKHPWLAESKAAAQAALAAEAPGHRRNNQRIQELFSGPGVILPQSSSSRERWSWRQLVSSASLAVSGTPGAGSGSVTSGGLSSS